MPFEYAIIGHWDGRDSILFSHSHSQSQEREDLLQRNGVTLPSGSTRAVVWFG